MHKRTAIVLHYRAYDSTDREFGDPPDAVTVKEAFEMHDSFSEGGVFYGRTAIAMGVVVVLAFLLHLI